MKKVLIIILTLFFLFSCENSNSNKKNDLQKQSSNSVSSDPKPNSVKIILENASVNDIDTLLAENLWKKYLDVRSRSKEALINNDLDSCKLYLLEATECAKKLDRNDIAAWQLNNIGYYLIEDFKKKTDYANRMKEIESYPFGQEKLNYIQDTKILYNENIKQLYEIKKYLEEAYELDSEYDYSERTKIIYSNLKFVDWICNFIRD